MPSREEREYREPINKLKLLGTTAIAGLIALGVLASSITVVGPNQAACFRTFGHVDCGPEIQVNVDGKPETSHQYYGQGHTYFVLPFGITDVDKLQISQRLTEPHTTKLTLGQQNQPAEVDYQLLVNIPLHGTHTPDGKYVDSVHHLLYEVGSAGNSGVDNVVDRFIDAGLNKSFAPIEPDVLSTQRDKILDTVTHKVSGDLADLGVLIDSEVKVSRFELEGAWKQAANDKVISIGKKNAAENTAEAARLEGLGQGEAIFAKAQKQAEATQAITDANSAYITKMRAAFGGDTNALSIFLMTKTNTVPQVLGASGVQVIPSMTNRSAAQFAVPAEAAPK